MPAVSAGNDDNSANLRAFKSRKRILWPLWLEVDIEFDRFRHRRNKGGHGERVRRGELTPLGDRESKHFLEQQVDASEKCHHFLLFSIFTLPIYYYILDTMKSQYLTKHRLPDAPGVYLFKKGKQILYIGKAPSLRSGVRSCFSKDIGETRGPRSVGRVETATGRGGFPDVENLLPLLKQ